MSIRKMGAAADQVVDVEHQEGLSKEAVQAGWNARDEADLAEENDDTPAG